MQDTRVQGSPMCLVDASEPRSCTVHVGSICFTILHEKHIAQFLLRRHHSAKNTRTLASCNITLPVHASDYIHTRGVWQVHKRG
eukprot:6177255-Pleurochrysis_carterae.AAC.1